MDERVYIYSRFSTLKQAKGDSARRQLESCSKFAAKIGLPIDTSLTDHGVSAYTGANRTKGALGTFARLVEEGMIAPGSYLIMDSLDRFTRDTQTEFLHLLTGLTRRGIKVASVTDNLVLSEDSEVFDYLRVMILASEAYNQSVAKGLKVAAAHGESKRKARTERRVWHRAGPSWLEAVVDGDGKLRTISFRPIPERVAVIRRIFDMREAGLGTTAIAVRLTQEGVPPPKGGKNGWHHSAILEVLKNRAVLGEYQPKVCPKGHRGSRRPKDGEAIPGYYGAPIVSEEQFYRIQAIIAAAGSQKVRQPNRRRVTTLFSGIARCGECGATMGIHVTKGGRTPVLRCYDAPRGRCGNRTRYPYPQLEEAILRGVADFDLTRKAPQASLAEEAVESARGRLIELDDQISNLLDSLSRLRGNEALEDRIQQRSDERDSLRAQLSKLQDAARADTCSVDPEARRREIETLFAAMAGQDERQLFNTRNRLSQAIRDVVTSIKFTPETTHTMVFGASDKTTTVTIPPGFDVSVLDGLSSYVFRMTADRDFEAVWSASATAELLKMPRYAKRFLEGDPAREAKARRVLKNLAGTKSQAA